MSDFYNASFIYDDWTPSQESQPPSSNYMVYLLAVQYWISIICFSNSLIFWFKTINDFLVKLKSTVIRFTPCISLFMLTGVISSFASILHLLYMAFLWRPNENLYQAEVIFWTGIIMQYFQLICSCALGLTIIDRIFHMLTINHYSVRLQKLVAYFGVFISMTTLLIICIFAISTNIPKSHTPACFTTSCQIFMKSGQLLLNTRGIVAVLNFTLGLTFFTTLKTYVLRNKDLRRTHMQKSRKSRTKLIAYTIIYETLFQFLPLAIAFLSSHAFNFNVSSLFGAYNIFLTSLQYGITSIYYYRIFKGLKWRRKPQEIQWAFTTEFPKDRISTAPGRLRDFLT